MDCATPHTFYWNFGNCEDTSWTPSVLEFNGNVYWSPTYSYSQAGTYTIHFKSTDACGVDDTSAVIVVTPPPNVYFTADTVCFEDTTSFGFSILPTWS